MLPEAESSPGKWATRIPHVCCFVPLQKLPVKSAGLGASPFIPFLFLRCVELVVDQGPRGCSC